MSSDEERADLLATFLEGGQDGLLTALQKVKPRVGYIRTPNSLGYVLKDGNGEGRMAVGTKISRSKDGISPVALKNIAVAK